MKVWWVQAECMVSALKMYVFTDDPHYVPVFTSTATWITKHQIDWEKGDWHHLVSEEGEPHGPKAGPWKAPYHNGRAVLRCLELLEEL